MFNRGEEEVLRDFFLGYFTENKTPPPDDSIRVLFEMLK